ncbi:MAG: ATP-binding protein, partial [Spirochaetales bacterium]|nr:ATP-binding protein [Spirochaetales bacterium]
IIQYGPTYINSSTIIFLCLILTMMLILVGTHLYHFFFKKGEGFRLQLQLVIIFFLLIIFASVPQSLLAVNMVEASMELWGGEDLEKTLDDSSGFLSSYKEEMGANLSSLGESSYMENAMVRYGREGSFAWEELAALNGLIDTVQFFTDGEGELYGNPEYGVELSRVKNSPDGLLPVVIRHDLVLMSFVRRYEGITVVLTSSLLPGTGIIESELDEYLDRLLSYNRYQQDSLRWKLYVLFFFIFPLMLVSINLAILFARNMIRPVEELGMALRKVTEGDYSYRISAEEFGMYDFYVDIFNEMIDELNSSRSELVQTEKIGVWRDIAQRLAHEIRNPLTPIKLNAQRILLKASEMDENTQKYLLTPMNRILKEVDELDLLLREFREFAGQRAPVLKKLILTNIVDEVWDSYGKKDREDVIFTVHDEETGRTVLGDDSQLKQVFRNIFSNALESMEYKGRLSVRINTVMKGAAGFCRIAIRDWGRGIDEETLTRIFEPYYTTRKTGTGLGLPIVERIITDHKGRIWVESSPGEGTVFYIDLPIGRNL